MNTHKTNEIDLSNDGVLRRYMRVMRKSKPWNISFYACVDHCDISPIYQDWQKSLNNGRVSKDWPRLVEVILHSDELLDARYSEDKVVYDGAVDIALNLCKEKLSGFKNEDDFIELLMNKEESEFFHGSRSMLSMAVLGMRKDKLSPQKSIAQAEAYFSDKLRGREYFSDANKKLTKAFPYLV